MHYFSSKHTPICGAALSGLLLTGAFPKWGVPPVAWVALVPLLISIRNASAAERFRLGLVTGLVHYATLLYWLIGTMQTFGGIPWIGSLGALLLLAAYLGLYTAAFSTVLAWVAITPAGLFLAPPCLWVCLEYIRTAALTGFPWGILGCSQAPVLQILQVSDIFGVYGVSFLIVLVNAAIALAWLHLRNADWRNRPVSGKSAALALLTGACLVAACLLYGKLRIRQIDAQIAAAPTVQTAVVQANIAQDVKWDPDFADAAVTAYEKLTRNAAALAPDLVVWPETATPFYLFRDVPGTRRVLQTVRRTGAAFLIGTPAAEHTDSGVRYFNRALLLGPDGSQKGAYDKSHLVPFGEYVPCKKWLPFVQKMVTGAGDFTPGRKGAILAWDKGRIGVQICYEMIFPALSRKAVRNGAELLANLTNDAWYGRSSAPYQLFAMAVVRAVENRRAVIRAANTGISGHIDPAGRVLDTTPLFETAVRTSRVPKLSTQTCYTRWGDWFPIGCGVILILMMTHTGRRRRR